MLNISSNIIQLPCSVLWTGSKIIQTFCSAGVATWNDQVALLLALQDLYFWSVGWRTKAMMEPQGIGSGLFLPTENVQRCFLTPIELYKKVCQSIRTYVCTRPSDYSVAPAIEIQNEALHMATVREKTLTVTELPFKENTNWLGPRYRQRYRSAK